MDVDFFLEDVFEFGKLAKVAADCEILASSPNIRTI